MSWGRNFCRLQLILLWPFFFEVQLVVFEVPAIPIAKWVLLETLWVSVPSCNKRN